MALALIGHGAWAGSSAPTLPPSASAAPAPATGPVVEERNKAAYLQQLLGYVEWPTGTFLNVDTPMVVGVVGAEPVFAELQRLSHLRPSGGRVLQVRRLLPNDTVEGLHVLFLGNEGEAVRREWIERLRDAPVLVVSERAAGLPPGAMVNLVTTQGRQRFEASPEAAERVGLKFSSRLLAVAERVVNAP
jgi:hypothetical protein